MNSDELAPKIANRPDGRVDTLALRREIGIERAGYYAGMPNALIVQTDEVPAVVGQQCTIVLRGEFEDVLVGPGLIRFAGFRDGDDVMTSLTQSLDNGQGEVLVRV